jgi:hypothetical protein
MFIFVNNLTTKVVSFNQACMLVTMISDRTGTPDLKIAMTNIHEHVTAAPATVSVEFRVRKLDVER